MSSSSPPRSPSPSSFFDNELRLSLTEQQFGIRSFTLLPTPTSLTAKASVILLDGTQLYVALTSRGYVVCSCHAASMMRGLTYAQVERGLERKSSPIFETLEALLGSVSDLYEQKRTELLWTKLQNI
ncbi:hypothetical protein BDZ89DRAFT_325868 [Hymenopellis radicata]|nr:hypothetical protein BDZ89DRAFT_325868 [Hymenopellis radicata]